MWKTHGETNDIKDHILPYQTSTQLSRKPIWKESNQWIRTWGLIYVCISILDRSPSCKLTVRCGDLFLRFSTLIFHILYVDPRGTSTKSSFFPEKVPSETTFQAGQTHIFPGVTPHFPRQNPQLSRNSWATALRHLCAEIAELKMMLFSCSCCWEASWKAKPKRSLWKMAGFQIFLYQIRA